MILTLIAAGGVNTSVVQNARHARLSVSSSSALSCAAPQPIKLGWVGSHRRVVAALDGYTVTVSTTVEATGYPGLEELHPTDITVELNDQSLTTWLPLASAQAYLGGLTVPEAISATSPVGGKYSPFCLGDFPGQPGPDLVMTVATGVMQYVDEELEIFSPSRLNAAVDDLGFANGLQLGRIGSQLAIVTSDASFEGVFAPDAQSSQPIEVLVPEGADVERIAFVTENFPRLVSTAAAATWKTDVAGASAADQGGFYDPLGVLASWAAEQCVIGFCPAAFDRVRRFVTDQHLKFPLFGTASLESYLAELRSLLIDQGYLRPPAA